jgi:hypothetical protein
VNLSTKQDLPAAIPASAPPSFACGIFAIPLLGGRAGMIHGTRVHGAATSALRLRREIRAFLFSITGVAQTSITIVSIPTVSAVTITIALCLVEMMHISSDLF